jgi:hypothetical protein
MLILDIRRNPLILPGENMRKQHSYNSVKFFVLVEVVMPHSSKIYLLAA